ncbi:MAG: hypothetical protein JRN15_21845 [Nitrososphaerota archaeon]|nr:hypothetical protein [Nitrososphaerota archaeon]
MRKRKEKPEENYSNSTGKDGTNEEHGEILLTVKRENAEREYSKQFYEHQKRLEEMERSVTVEHLLSSSLDLDDAAKKHIDQILAIGSKRFARELVELLESASRCVEQNANLLKILKHHLNVSKPQKENNEQK